MTLSVWLVLVNLKSRRLANQRELAEAVGVREATLTHHLNTVDAEGLITRRRDTANRQMHIVEMTDAGGRVRSSPRRRGRLRHTCARCARRARTL